MDEADPSLADVAQIAALLAKREDYERALAARRAAIERPSRLDLGWSRGSNRRQEINR